MELLAVRIDLANAMSSRIVFLSQDEYERLVKAYENNKARYSVRHRLSQDDREDRRWHLDLNAVVSIVRL